MAQSFAQVYLHTVFGTKYRDHLITDEIAPKLFSYLGGIIKNLGGTPIEINGMPDHVHILSTLPRTITIAKYLEQIKKSSSKWMKNQHSVSRNFAWQNGYATFSVSSSKVRAVKRYIENQTEHHKKLNFKQEVIRFLEEYQVKYDEKYLWD